MDDDRSARDAVYEQLSVHGWRSMREVVDRAERAGHRRKTIENKIAVDVERVRLVRRGTWDPSEDTRELRLADHLDRSDSATVRRHAETFRAVRARLASGAGRPGGGADGEGVGRGYVDGTAADVTGNALRVLGARSAASVAEVAAENGWRVVGRFASHRRESDGEPIDAAVVMCMWVEASATPIAEARVVTRWAMGHWRTDPIDPPMKRKWKFTGATVKDAERGIRAVGARELTAKIISPMNDALECEHVPGDRGGEGPDGEGRS